MTRKPWLEKGDRVRFTSLLKNLYEGVYTVLEIDREGIGHYQVRLSGRVGWCDPAHLEQVEADDA